MAKISARRRSAALQLAGLLVAVVGVLAACGREAPSGPGEPVFAGAGRFVLDSVPFNIFRNCCSSIDVTADTLELDAGGAAHRVVVLRQVSSNAYDPHRASFDSTTTQSWTGSWQASRSAVQIVLNMGPSAVALHLTARRDGGLQDTASYLGYSRR